MWKILKTFNSGYGAAYSDCFDDLNQDTSKLPLDTIEVAGDLRVQDLRGATKKQPCLHFTQKAYSFISSAAFIKSITLPQYQKAKVERTATAQKWREHLLTLVATTIIIAIAWKDIKGAAKYFAVPKGTGASARAIFNGRDISSRMQTPPPVNLPFLPDLIDMMNEFPGEAAVLVADIRHWFHQVPLSKEVSEHFCVGIGGAWYRWRTSDGSARARRRGPSVTSVSRRRNASAAHAISDNPTD